MKIKLDLVVKDAKNGVVLSGFAGKVVASAVINVDDGLSDIAKAMALLDAEDELMSYVEVEVRAVPVFETGERVRFIGDGTGRNRVDGKTGPAGERITFDFRNKIATIFDGRGDASEMTVQFDDLPHAVWKMVKDYNDFETVQPQGGKE